MTGRTRANWKTYLMVVALSSAEGTVAMLVPPFLQVQGHDFSTIGFLVALLGIMALVSRLPGGVIYRPERGRAIMAGSLVTLGLACVLYPFAGDAWLFGAVRSLNGIALGLATTANLAMYMDAIPRGSDKARAMGIYGGSLAAGYSIGNFFGGVAGDLLGYTLAFGLAGAYCLLALVLLLIDPASRFEVPGSRFERPQPASQTLPSNLEPRTSNPEAGASNRLRALAEPQVVILSLVAFMLNFLHQVPMTFFPLYGLAIGLSLTEIGAIKGIHALTNAIARPLAGPPVSRFGHRRVSYVGIALLAAALTIIPMLQLFGLLLAIFVVIGLLRAMVLVANTTGVADIDETRISRGVASGLYNASKDVGNLASPIICGAVATAVGLVTMLTLAPPVAGVLFFGAIAGIRARANAAKRPRPGETSPG